MPALKRKDDSKYRKLVDRFPLVPIKNKGHLRQANSLIVELADRLENLSPDEYDYFHVLSGLIEEYESTIFPAEKFSARDTLRFLMKENGLSMSDMGKITGSRTHFSEFLSGKRELSKLAIVRLAKRFKVSSDLFLSDVC